MQGLQNIGSTCAVNSLIQIICREPHLRNTIINEELPEDSLVGHLKEILHLMHNENKSLVPGKFVQKLFSSLESIFRLGEQLDIGELWIFLFDKIASELNAIPNASHTLPQLPEDTEKSQEIDLGTTYKDDLEYKMALIQCPELRNKYEYNLRKFNQHKSSKWLESCQGFYLNIIRCQKCSNVLYNFEPFTSISLDIPEDHQCPSITVMLRDFLKEEKRHGDWKCSKCCEHTEYTKTTKIWKIPPVIIFIIKRFSHINSKNTKPININKLISFKRGSVLSNLHSDIKYTLSSIGMHFGSLHGGHYCALCNTEEEHCKIMNYEKIIFYDDLNITSIPKEKFVDMTENNSDGYMIVYSNRSPT
jgi:ubiquitin C-terminal hydrolase